MTSRPFRRQKPVTPARELERRIAALPPMPETEREEAIKRLRRDFGFSEDDGGRSYAGF